ncbi:MAG: carboxypeptidase regulatory-like domain-containing protein [Candidatus Methanoperedens sp.]|nr:carboxypeptidase regulatory-like domain-containing protein [Candidatus Methanoperedens sp.]
MNKNLYIVAVLAIIITTLSQTVSFISGEHQFYESVQDKCIKCHGDVKSQLSASANHSTYSCNFCHVKSATNHTNTKPECQYCHNVTRKLGDPLEAHTGFAPLNSQGCIACHTTYNTIVNYSRAEYIDYTITNSRGNWVISDVTTIGTLNLSYNALNQGGDHEIKNVSCKDCHKDIFDAVSAGGHAVVLNKNGTQVPMHNSTNSTQETWCRTCHNRNDTNFTTQQHSVRRTTCEGCHQAYNLTPHPGNLFTNMNTVPHLYRSLVCISCKSIGWPAPGGAIHFRVHEEPYFDVTYEIINPLSIVNSSPASDPTTMKGETQKFEITLNRAADIYWYNNGSEIFRALSVISSSYTTSSASAGVYNITAVADDGYTSIPRTWNWTVLNQTAGGGGGSGGGGGIITGSATGSSNSSNISGYVFDNNVLPLPGALVQNGSYQNMTNTSGFYSITNLTSGNYTFSYSKAGFDTAYAVFTLNGASIENVNVVIYDTTPPAQISNPNTTGGSFYINNTWVNPADTDFNYTRFRYSNGTELQNVNKSTDYLNLTWQPHYTQNISAQTVDTYGNINLTEVWFNATVPNNAPVQLQIGNKTTDEGRTLNFTVSATDADNDTITYGTNATKGSLNTTTGNFSWTPGYGDAGVYTWYFNSSDGYGGMAVENIAVTVNDIPLSAAGSSPAGDPVTAKGTPQTFEISLNRTGDITWYINGSEIFRFLGVASSSYTNSSADAGIYNITAFATDGYDSVSRTWIWNVTAGSGGGGGDKGSGSGVSSSSNVSGYVFDNYGSILPGALVQNGSYQNTTSASGYYSITGLPNGTYNFSYSKAGYSTGYFEFTLNGAIAVNANKTLYDTNPPASASNPSTATGNFYINNTWVNPIDADFNHTWFRYSNDTTLQNVDKSINYLNLTWQPHYTQNISAQTVDTSGNANQTKVWFNATIPNNVPTQAAIGDKSVNESESIQFNVTAVDADSDPITYGTNATKGILNTTTGNFSWTPGYGDAGVYTWYFNSSDGYGGVASETITVTVGSVPLLITSSLPFSDPATIIGTAQLFKIDLNRAADVTWYINGSIVQTNLSVISANYTNSTASIGSHNVTAAASDGYYSASRIWNWTVTPQPVYNVSGYVFDNYGSGLGGVLVQNGSSQSTTAASGYYQITGLLNGTYNFSYSKAGFNTGYLEVVINGADNASANRTIYDTTPAVSVSDPAMVTGSFYINNTWINPADADFNYTWFRYSNGTTLQSVNKPIDYLNLTWQPHYIQNISAQTVDTYGNVNQTVVWFNTTIPNNVPVLSQVGNKTVDEGQWLNFTVSATDMDSDGVVYGTNATKGTFNAAMGSFSWLTTYSDSGTYNWYFNSSDGYGGVATENIIITVNDTLLSVTSFSPLSDPATEQSAAQSFSVSLSRTANITWYVDGAQVQVNASISSANYTNSTAGIGVHNVTAIATDSYDSASKVWNWTVTSQSVYNVNGYVFDNYGSGLSGVLVQNDSKQNITAASGHYLITGLLNGTYNFSYSKAGFNTDYLEVTINGADNISANKTLYDTTPSASVSNPAIMTGNFYINNTWVNPSDTDFNHTWFRYSNGTTLANISRSADFLNLTWQPHYIQNISAQTVDTYGNVNQTVVWFNTTIPNNAPVLSQVGNKIVDEGQWLNFTVSATDMDNDGVVYGTNATKGTFSAVTGSFSWLAAYSDAGTYTWYFNSSDGYGGVAGETITITVNDVPLSITSSSPVGDPATTVSTAQTFRIDLNRTANVKWYIDNSIVQTNAGVISANYTNSTANIGVYNVTAAADDSYDSVSRTWNWTVIAQPTYSVSGYVFDNFGSGLGDVQVQSGSFHNTTLASGYYLITGLLNGTYNISYSRAGFNTGYLEVTINGADNTSADKTIYDTTPPAQVTGLMNDTPTRTTVNLTWNTAADANYYQVFRNSTSLGYARNNYWNDTGLTADALYEYMVRANDSYNNWGQNSSILSIRTAPAADTTPPASVSNPATATGNFYVNNTWTNPVDADYSYAWFRYSNGTMLTNVSKPGSFLNLTWQPHYIQNISAQAVDTSGNANQTMLWFNVTIPNNAPALSPVGNKTVDEGQWLNFTVSATDADSDTITYGTNATKGTFDTATGNFSWHTAYSDAGAYTWYFNSSDSYSGIASEAITITVNNVPLSVTSSSPPSDTTTTQGTPQSFSATLNRTADVMWYMNGTLVQTNTSTASAVYTNSTAGVGVWNITAGATDGTDTASRTWNWTVNAQPPGTYIPPDPANLQNTTGNFWVNHTWQAGAGNITDSYNVRVDGIWYNGTIDTFKNTTAAPHGWVNITVWAYNSSGTGSLSSGSISQDTQVPNNPPQQASIGNKAIDEGQWLNFTVNATDLDNDIIIYGTNATKGIFNAVTGNFSWLTTYSDAGAYVWYFNSSDSYGGRASETLTVTVNNSPLSVYLSSPSSDPTTTQGAAQDFSLTLNRTADVTWYMNGAQVQTNTTTTSATYTNSTAGVGAWNITANATDGIDTISRMWNWTVIAQPEYNVSGYVFDNYGSGLGGVQVQNGSKQGTTVASGYYLITGLLNGTYNFSYSRAGFDTGYLEVTINGADNTSADKTIYDTTPPAQVTGLTNDTPTRTTVNLTWNTAADANYYQVFRDSASLGYTRNNYWNDTGLTADTLYGYAVRANDSYNNWGQNSSVMNVRTAPAADTIPPAPVSNPAAATGNFYVNNTWTNPADADYSHAWFKYSNDSALQNVSKPTSYLNLTWSPHYTQNISAQTVDASGNVNQSKVWFNVTIPNNAPILSPVGNKTVDEGLWLNFTVSATDADSDTITYGTNATKGTFDAATGSYSWLTTYSDAGAYTWYFNSSDGYGGVASEIIIVNVNNVPLSTTPSPSSDPTTMQGTAQSFSMTLNRTADITWYMNGTLVQTNSSTASAVYTNSTAEAGTWNVTASAADNTDSVTRMWNWTVIVPVYNLSGYVFDNSGSGLGGVQIQNGSKQGTTVASGYYLITGLVNGNYNFSFSKAGFNTGYLEVAISSADIVNANKTIYDTAPPEGISNINAAPAPRYIYWTWTDPSDADLDHIEVYIDSTFKQNVTRGVQYYNASYFMPNSTHTISALTVDSYNNVNTTWTNNTATTASEYTYVSNFQNDTGTVSDFNNAQNASDGGASANFSEVQVDGAYHLNITTNTTEVPDAGTHTLHLGYSVSGDDFVLQLWNGTAWNNRTTLNDTALSYRNITLQAEELIPQGASTGNAGSIGRYYVLVRYLDLTASPVQQGILYLDYQRVYSE